MIAVYEQGKPRIVSLDILKEFRGENNVHGWPSDPPHPSFTGGDEITEIPNSGQERPMAEGIKNSENRLNQGERDRREGGRIADQPEQQWKGQTDRETQITPSCEEGGEG